jgi:thiamine-monophosphate kinase
VLSITTTVLGHCFEPLRRNAVRPGDRLYVTGRLGGPSLVLEAWREGREPDPASRARFASPTPRLLEARWLATAGATAAIDVSDGLVADLGHLARASGVRIEMHAERVPRHAGADAVRAMQSGEEYELVAASPVPIDAAAFHARFGLELSEIGVATDGAPDVEVREGTTRVAPPLGHDHFSA